MTATAAWCGVVRRTDSSPTGTHRGGADGAHAAPTSGERLATGGHRQRRALRRVECGVSRAWSWAGDAGGTGEPPYPENHEPAAVAEIGRPWVRRRRGAKGDLPPNGIDDEFRAFLAPLQARLATPPLRTWQNQRRLSGRHSSALPTHRGVVLRVILAISTPPCPAGRRAGQRRALEWLDELGSGRPPRLVFRAPPPLAPGSPSRPDGYFGIHPDESERLVEWWPAPPAIGVLSRAHTHRNRVRRFPSPVQCRGGGASVKDFRQLGRVPVFEGASSRSPAHLLARRPGLVERPGAVRRDVPVLRFGRLEDAASPCRPGA